MECIVKNMKFGDLSLEYSMTGEGDGIIVFHGGHSNCYEEFGYRTLIASGYSIITPSRAGYGNTSAVQDLDIACEMYEALLGHLGIHKVHIIAVSQKFIPSVESVILDSWGHLI